MTDEMTDERLAEIREGLAEFDRRRLETSMSGGVDTPGRVTYHFGPSPDGLPRYSIPGMLPEIATELMTEVDRLREEARKQAADELTRLGTDAEEIHWLREQVETLQAERDAMAEDYDCWDYSDAAGHGWPADHRYSEAHTERCRKRWATPWLPVIEEGPTP